MRKRSSTACVFACLLMSSLAQSPAGTWKESPHYKESAEGEMEESTVKVWDSYPNLGLKFRWLGEKNARHEAEGEGRLNWYKEGEEGDVIMSTFEGTMKQGMREGRGRLQLRSGATYNGDWRQNLKHGSGMYYYASGDSYKGEFANDAMHGTGTYSEADGTTYTGGFVNGQRDGNGRVTLANGRSYDSEWSAGIELPGSLSVRAAKLAEAPTPPHVGVTLDHDYMQKLAQDSENLGTNAFLYRSQFANGAIQIEPNFSWLDAWRETGHVEHSQIAGDWTVGPVPLILTVNNPGTGPVTISSGRLLVEKSSPDLQPLLVFHGSDVFSIHLFGSSGEEEEADGKKKERLAIPSHFMLFGMTNEGEGKASNCVLDFNLTPLGQPHPAGTHAFTKKLGTLDERLTVDLKEEFAGLGVSLTKLAEALNSESPSKTSAKNARDILGPFARFDEKGKWIESNAMLTGKLSYEWTDADGKTHKESTEVTALVIVDPRDSVEFGAAGPMEGDYHLALKLQGRDYTMPFPFRKRLPAGGNARLRLRLCAPKVSDHRFQVILKCSDGSELRSLPIQMHYFLPRGYTDFIENGKAPIEAP